MEYRHIGSADQFFAEADRWNELVDNGVTRQAYLTHEWFRAWWSAFGADKELATVIACEGDHWMGIAPLCIGPRAVGPFRVRSLQFATSDIGPRCEFILREDDPQLARALVEGMTATLGGWAICCLDSISEDSLTFKALLSVLREQRVTFEVSPHKTSPYLLIDGSWDEYMTGLSQSRRYEIRRSWREIHKLGAAVSVRCMTAHDEIMEHLPKLFDVSARSWKKQENTDMGATAASREFYRQLSDALSRRGQLAVWIVEADGNPIAMLYCLCDKGRIIELRSDFDDTLRKAAPGNALMGYALKDCFDKGVAEHDFAGAAYKYKLNYANHVRTLHSFEIYPPRLFSRLLYAARKLKRSLKRPKSAISP